MSGSVVASPASLPAEVAPSDQPGGAGSLRWQRARLVLDQHQRGVDAGPVGQVLPVHAGLAHLLPHRGLRRGSTVVVRGSTTVLLALLAEATAEGSWAAVVGMPDIGLLAAAELGVAVSRLALVPRPGAELGAVVAALLDGLDVVAVAATGSLTKRAGSLTTLARRLSARARNRESVLVSFGPWPGADLELDCTGSHWTGLGDGYGHLVEREITITVRGRGMAARPATDRIHLPANQKPAEITPPALTPRPSRLTRMSRRATQPHPISRPLNPTGTPELSPHNQLQPPAKSKRPGSAGLSAVVQPPAASAQLQPPAVSEQPGSAGLSAVAQPSAASAQPQPPAVSERPGSAGLSAVPDSSTARPNQPQPEWAGPFTAAEPPTSPARRAQPGPPERGGSPGPLHWRPDSLTDDSTHDSAHGGAHDLRPSHLSAVPNLPAGDALEVG